MASVHVLANKSVQRFNSPHNCIVNDIVLGFKVVLCDATIDTLLHVIKLSFSFQISILHSDHYNYCHKNNIASNLCTSLVPRLLQRRGV